MNQRIRIGTRESQLAVWQATLVQQMLLQHGFESELVYIKSEGDTDLQTPLYEMGVQGVFTRSLDSALMKNRIDIAVHSMKDVPTQLPTGIIQAAVLKRGPVKDLLVYKGEWYQQQQNGNEQNGQVIHIATSSIRRKAQWLHRFPGSVIHNLRGNVNTRLRKLQEEAWDGAIFAAAGLERIGLRPENAVELDWMLPAPAQGAIMVVCREEDHKVYEACSLLNDSHTALCTSIEREFLRTLLGGCSTPISALAEINGTLLHFTGSICSTDGQEQVMYQTTTPVSEANELGKEAAQEILIRGGQAIADEIRNSK
ncbi:MAG: hydroxymethylbilane synthase [Lacibacter sp.]